MTSVSTAPAGAPAPDYQALYLAAQRRYERERRARQQAETIAEEGLRTLHQRGRHAELMAAVARHANGSSSQVEALQSTLVEICAHTGWVCGFVYVPNTDVVRKLELSSCWLARGEGLDPFVATTRTARFLPRHGLPGRVYASAKAAWIEDVASDDNFPRKPDAISCGLRTGVAFPILIEDEVAAVVEFFAREAQAPDDDFLTILEAIGTQLGRVVERERTRRRLMHDATHDSLTGLPNRALFLTKLETRIDRARVDSNQSYSVLFIDLDRFKLINDSLGHRAGDALLLAITDRFGTALMQSDHSHVLARLGGDEFVILLDQAPKEVGARIAEELLASLACPITIEGHQLYGSASIGVTSGEFVYGAAADVLRDADLAMYEAKGRGKGRVALFEPQLHLHAMTRLAMESDLRSALRTDRFVLHYQPIVSISDQQVIGFEALVRWQKAPGVLVPPGAFIEIAEETGLIVFIGEVVLRKACTAIARWNAARPSHEAICVSVNVSARQFQQADFVQTVERALALSGALPKMLRLEVTESVAIANVQHTIAILEHLRTLGVRVSIDDFGTGHSSLSYIHQLTFDTIKIDRSFVQGMGAAKDGQHIVQTILELARNLNVTVVAEGAETQEQMSDLERLGCPLVQGYFISRPLDEGAATAWLSTVSSRVERSAGKVADLGQSNWLNSTRNQIPLTN